MQELRGKVAVVTGAGSGIGRAMATRFAAEGMRVALADVEEGALKDAVDAIEEATPGCTLLTHVTDVRHGAEVEGLADAVYDEWGQVDVLCNNAGVFVGGYLWERPPADLEFVLGVNLWGILHGIRAFVPRMIAQDTEGHVVNTASIAGLLGSPYAGPYTISKFAALAASEALAGDLIASGSKLRASALCPGIVKTRIVESDRNRPADLATPLTGDQEFVTAYLNDAVTRGIDPADVAGLVVDAIRAERFLILTHPHHGQYLVARAEQLAAGELPAIADFE